MDEQTGDPRKRTFTEEIELAAKDAVETIKRLVAEGNVRRVRVRTATGENPFLEIPVTGGVVGGGILLIAAPWLAALGALAAIVAKVRIEIVREIDAEPTIADQTPPVPPSA